MSSTASFFSILTRQARRLTSLAGLALLSLATTLPAAPEYALSGRAPLLDKVVLAETPAGPVTALDVLMFDEMTGNRLGAIPVEAWLTPGSAAAQPYAPAMKEAVERLQAYRALAQRAGDFQPSAEQIKVDSFGAAKAVWVEHAVRPQVQVRERDIDLYYLAHPEKYIGRRSVQVRYIFNKTNPADPVGQQAARQALNDLATKIRNGQLSFEEAARTHSEAASAAQGGLIPPFSTGERFPAFQNAAFALTQPGQLSPVFEGPEGIYLVQLVSSSPARNVPIAQVREQIRQELTLDHIRHYYAYELGQLARKHFIDNKAALWSYLNQEAPIARVDKIALSRPDYLRFYPNPTNSNYEVDMDNVLRNTGSWIEGQTITQDLAARGQMDAPWIQRARKLAELQPKAQSVYQREAPAAAFQTTQTAINSILANKQFVQGMRDVHVVRFELSIPKPENLSPDQLRTAQTLATAIGQQLQQGVVPTQPTPLKLSDWVAREAANEQQLATSVENLDEQLKVAQYLNLRMRAKDIGWVSSLPGTPWHDRLATVKQGQVSTPQVFGNTTFYYLVVAERPVDVRQWEAKPLLTRALAFELQAGKIFYDELSRIRQSGEVKFTF